MSQIILYIFFGLVILLTLIVGCLYASRCRQFNKNLDRKYLSISFQSQVKEQRHVYGISNRGTSMDSCDIYVLPISTVGINE